MLRVVGSFAQTYMPRNFPSTACALALAETSAPRAARQKNRLFSMWEPFERYCPRATPNNFSPIQEVPGPTRSVRPLTPFFECPLLAQSRHELVRRTCLLSGGKADMTICGMSAFVVAIGGEADMAAVIW